MAANDGTVMCPGENVSSTGFPGTLCDTMGYGYETRGAKNTGAPSGMALTL